MFMYLPSNVPTVVELLNVVASTPLGGVNGQMLSR